jgi:hypothetical protein
MLSEERGVTLANLDLSELMEDPDFCDNFQFIRQVETVGENGRASVSKTRMYGYGAILPLSGRTLQLMPALANSSGTIEIWSKTPLQTQTAGLKPDLVEWRGNQYQVTAIPGDFSNFGEGFRKYVGTLFDLQSAPVQG